MRDVTLCTYMTDNGVSCPTLMATTKQEGEGAQSARAHTVPQTARASVWVDDGCVDTLMSLSQ